jgi:hypothetical protein
MVGRLIGTIWRNGWYSCLGESNDADVICYSTFLAQLFFFFSMSSLVTIAMAVSPLVGGKVAKSTHHNMFCTSTRRMMGRRRYASTALLALTASVQSYSAVFVPLTTVTSSNRGFLDIPRGGSTTKDPTAQAVQQRSFRTTSTSLSQSATVESTSSSTDNIIMSSTMTPAAKLEALRSKMKELDLDVYLVPSGDPHLSGKM